jgi:hypothetical protein
MLLGQVWLPTADSLRMIGTLCTNPRSTAPRFRTARIPIRGAIFGGSRGLSLSHDALTWAYRQAMLRPSCRFVLVTLADRANHEGVCWPSHADLAERTGYTVRSVLRCLDELVQRGLVERIARQGHSGRATSSLYVLHMERGHGMAAVGARMQLSAEAHARLRRPCATVDNSPKAVDMSVDQSTGERLPCHPPANHLIPPKSEEEQELMARHKEKLIARMSPLESNTNPDPVTTASGQTKSQAVDKSVSASLPTSTQTQPVVIHAKKASAAAAPADMVKERPSRAANSRRPAAAGREGRQSVQPDSDRHRKTTPEEAKRRLAKIRDDLGWPRR